MSRAKCGLVVAAVAASAFSEKLEAIYEMGDVWSAMSDGAIRYSHATFGRDEPQSATARRMAEMQWLTFKKGVFCALPPAALASAGVGGWLGDRTHCGAVALSRSGRWSMSAASGNLSAIARRLFRSRKSTR